MSIRIPDYNAAMQGSGCFRLIFPTSATDKPANTASVTLMWFRTRDQGYDSNASHIVLARGTGLTGNNDGVISLNQDITVVNSTVRVTGTAIHTANWATAPATGLSFGTSYMLGQFVRNGWIHLVLCPVGGGTPLINSVPNTAVYAAAMTGATQSWASIGGGSGTTARGNYTSFEEFNFFHGAFPETSNGVPDTTLIQNLANGTQSLAGLTSLLVQEGSNPCAHIARYPMQHQADFSATVGSAGPLTVNVPAGAAAANQNLFTGGFIRPSILRPTYTRDRISQAIFATPGNAETATARVRVEAGAYSGMPTLAKIQVRLLDESRSVVADWIDLSPTVPSSGAGTWPESNGFANIVMRPNYLTRHFRALDASNNVLAEEYGSGVSGVGFNVVTTAQSQLMFIYVNAEADGDGAYPYRPGIRAIIHRQTTATLPNATTMLSSASADMRGGAKGIRYLINEIDARFPGVPIQADTMGQSGEEIEAFFPASALNSIAPSRGIHAARPTLLRANYGVHQPYFFYMMGHSGTSGQTNYHLFVEESLLWHTSQLGAPIKTIQAPVARKVLVGTDEAGAPADSYRNSRRGTRQECIDHPERSWFGGSYSNVQTRNDFLGSGGSLGHSSNRAEGQGRIGSLIAWQVMSCARAIPDVPLGISAVKAVGSTAVIEFGPVNP